MGRNLTFGQKLAIIIGCALLIEGAIIVGIAFYYSKNGPPKDIEKLVPQWAQVDLKNEETWAKTEEFSSIQIEQNPKAAFWYKERGYARWWLKKYDQAITDFDKAIELDPKDYTSLSYRGQLRTHKELYKLAIEDFDKVISVQPGAGRSYYNRGVAYDWLNDRKKALADYDKALELGYEKRRVHNAKGSLYAREKVFEKAREEYEAAAKTPQSGKNDDTFEHLIRLYISEGQMQKAQEASKRWIEESHTDDSYRAAISIARALENKEEETTIQRQYITNLTERIAEEADTLDLCRKRAYAYKQIGDKERADRQYDDLLKRLDAQDAGKQNIRWRMARRAEILKEAGRKNEANKVYEEELAQISRDIKKNPKDEKLYTARAFAYMSLDNPEAALKDFQKAGSKENSSSIVRAKCEIAIKHHQHEAAVALVKETGKREAYSHILLARIHEKMGAHAEAVAEAGKAIEQNRTMPAAYYWLGKALAAQGKSAESKQRLQQARALGYEQRTDD